MRSRRIPRHAAEPPRGPNVTFTDAFGDATTGVFLGIESGDREPARILVGGRVVKRATRSAAGDDRTFDLTFA